MRAQDIPCSEATLPVTSPDSVEQYSNSIYYPKTRISCSRLGPPSTQSKPKGDRMATAVLGAGDIESTVLHFIHNHDSFQFDKCLPPLWFPLDGNYCLTGRDFHGPNAVLLEGWWGSLWPLIGWTSLCNYSQTFTSVQQEVLLYRPLRALTTHPLNHLELDKPQQWCWCWCSWEQSWTHPVKWPGWPNTSHFISSSLFPCLSPPY